MVPAAGGIPIKNGNGEIVGAVGISGDSSDSDEKCAYEALDKYTI